MSVWVVPENRRIEVHGTPAPEGASNWNADAYVRACRNVVRAAFDTETGRAVRDAVARLIRIQPYRSSSVCNADVVPANELAANPRGENVYYCGDNPNTPIIETGRPVRQPGTHRPYRGTGRGTSCCTRWCTPYV